MRPTLPPPLENILDANERQGMYNQFRVLDAGLK
jgi:hypothetical protein